MAQDRACPGRDAIDEHCSRFYLEGPAMVVVRASNSSDGPDPLDFARAFLHPGDAEAGSPRHWHYVGCGLSDLYGDGSGIFAPKPAGSEGVGKSGCGFELTFRLAVADGEEQAPIWPVHMMNILARYVLSSGSAISPGHYLTDVTKQCARMHAIAVVDPMLGVIRTPIGSVEFVQLVLVGQQDLDVARAWNPYGFTTIMQRFPDMGGVLLVANREDGSSLLDVHPEATAEIEQRVAEEGSTVTVSTTQFLWSPRHFAQAPEVLPRVRLVFGPRTLHSIVMALRGRLGHGHGYCIENMAALEGELSRTGAPRCRVLFLTDGVTSFPQWGDIFASPDQPFVRLPGDCDLQIYLTIDQAKQLATSMANNALGTDIVLPRLFTFSGVVPGLEIHMEDDIVVKQLSVTSATTEEFEEFVRTRFPNMND